MELSPKAIRYVVESLQYYRDYHDQRLNNEELTEDEISDLTNDREYLNAIIQEFQNCKQNTANQKSVI